MKKMKQDFFQSLQCAEQFKHVEVSSCNVENTSITNLTFLDAILSQCCFTNTDLSGIGFFENCVVENCVFNKVDFRSAALVSVKFINCQFISCDFRGVHFKTSLFENVVFDKCKIIDTEINSANFKNVTYIGKLVEAKFFSEQPKTKLLIDFSQCKFDFVSFENCDLTTAKLPLDKNCLYIDNLSLKVSEALKELNARPDSYAKKILTRRLKNFSQQDSYIFNVKNFVEIEGKEIADAFFSLLGHDVL